MRPKKEIQMIKIRKEPFRFTRKMVADFADLFQKYTGKQYDELSVLPLAEALTKTDEVFTQIKRDLSSSDNKKAAQFLREFRALEVSVEEEMSSMLIQMKPVNFDLTPDWVEQVISQDKNLRLVLDDDSVVVDVVAICYVSPTDFSLDVMRSDGQISTILSTQIHTLSVENPA
jgi:hypothetical protein